MTAWHRARETWTTVDDTDIELVVRDRLPDWGLTRLGRRIAARQLTERGVHPSEIAELIGVTERTVYRWQAQARQQSAA